MPGDLGLVIFAFSFSLDKKLNSLGTVRDLTAGLGGLAGSGAVDRPNVPPLVLLFIGAAEVEIVLFADVTGFLAAAVADVFLFIFQMLFLLTVGFFALFSDDSDKLENSAPNELSSVFEAEGTLDFVGAGFGAGLRGAPALLFRLDTDVDERLELDDLLLATDPVDFFDIRLVDMMRSECAYCARVKDTLQSSETHP
jgi:hypothetical protein